VDREEMIQEEEIEGRAYDAKIIKRLLSYLHPYLAITAISVLVIMAGSLLQLAGPYLTKIAIDDHIRLGDWSGLDRIALLYLMVLVSSFFIQFLRVYLMQLVGQRAVLGLRTEVYQHLIRLPMKFFDRNPVGRLITRVVNDVEVLNELFTQGVVTVFGDLFLLAGITIALFFLQWKLAFVALLVSPLLVVLTSIYRKKARDAYRKVRLNVAQMNAFLQENLSGTTVVQLFGKEEQQFRRFDRMNCRTRDELLLSIRYNALFFPAVEVMAYTATGLVIWYGGGQVIQSAILPGVLVAFIQYLRLFFQPIRDLAEKYNLLQAAMASSERIFKLLDTPDELGMADKLKVVTGPNPSFRGEVRFENVWFGYDPDRPVLKGISFSVEAGERVAIVGPTGAGKSSLIHVLFRFYEIQRGRILIDGIDIRNLDRYELRRHIGIVLQDVFLFHGTVEENIRLGRLDIPERKLQEVSQRVHTHQFIEKLPGGYGHILSERGSNLSLGQRQLLAFARAIALDPTILILDEATSSVDAETEGLVQEALGRLIEGRTSLIIAHRLSTIQSADRIIVIHKGRVHEMGTHNDLLSQKGIYYRLHQIQFGEGV
jgi:ATP-binding cassette subfamily B protein